MQKLIIGLNTLEYDLSSGFVVTTLHDGKSIPAAPLNSDQYKEKCFHYGYNNDWPLFCIEHEAAQSLLAIIQGHIESHAFRCRAVGVPYEQAECEEVGVLGFQLSCRASGVSILELARVLPPLLQNWNYGNLIKG